MTPIWFETLSAAQRAELTANDGAPLVDKPDVLIVGGGIVGLALAYFLAESKARVQVIEAGSFTSGATGANLGGIWPNDQGGTLPAGFQSLALQSRDLWGRLSVRPGFDFDWRVNGFLNVNPERFPPSAPEYAARVQEQGYTVTSVDAEQIAALEPQLRPGLAAGLHYPSEAHLHPVKAALSFARAAKRQGASIATNVRATGVRVDNNRVIEVATTAGRVSPGNIVVATGCSAEWLGAAKPPALPVRPVSGQLISTGPLPPLLKSAVGGKFLILQLRSGEIVTGGNVLEGDCLTPNENLSNEFAAAARDLVPALKDVLFTRAWCGLRPGSPDGLPILDRAPTADNLWLSCGHFRNGVLLAPAGGKLLAEWITRGDARSEELAPFRWDRFR